MNRIATTPRGFPFDEKTLSELQEQTVPVLNAIAKLFPDNSIAWGCGFNWETLTRQDGFIIWNGEFLPFVGGAPSSNFSIVENIENRVFNIGTDQDPQLEDHPAYFKRFAQIGTITGAESVHLMSALRAKPRFLTYLNKGTRFCGTISPVVYDTEGVIIEINFNEPTTNGAYMVFCNFYRNNQSAQGSFDFDIFNKTTGGFKIRLKGITGTVSNLFVDYLIIPKDIHFSEIPQL
tara:strand:- start:169 stop:870 length:702 start_codon:yes stop_codon:yes gene_type:complete